MTIDTPTAAKAFARDIAARCVNDEIRAIVADELLNHIPTPDAADVREACHAAQDSAAALVTAFDRQYRD